MAVQQQRTILSEEEYLTGELAAEVKHEYIGGQVYAMAGASKNHVRIANDLARHFGNHLENTPCEVFSSDMKIKAAGNFHYPDVMVVCEDDSGQEYYTERPILIVEVLSGATRRIDRTLKKLAYQNLASLREYVLIEQDFVDVEVCRRDEYWQSGHYFLGDEVYFSAIDLRLPVAAIYARVANKEMREFRARGG